MKLAFFTKTEISSEWTNFLYARNLWESLLGGSKTKTWTFVRGGRCGRFVLTGWLLVSFWRILLLVSDWYSEAVSGWCRGIWFLNLFLCQAQLITFASTLREIVHLVIGLWDLQCLLALEDGVSGAPEHIFQVIVWSRRTEEVCSLEIACFIRSCKDAFAEVRQALLSRADWVSEKTSFLEIECWHSEMFCTQSSSNVFRLLVVVVFSCVFFLRFSGLLRRCELFHALAPFLLVREVVLDGRLWLAFIGSPWHVLGLESLLELQVLVTRSFLGASWGLDSIARACRLCRNLLAQIGEVSGHLGHGLTRPQVRHSRDWLHNHSVSIDFL